MPAEVLIAMLRSDSGRPRLTFYDDAKGPTQGERIELSAKVLANWVNKAGNALQEELDAEPESQVLLDLPIHWRAVYWALATWSVGATLVVSDEPTRRGPLAAAADVVVTDDPGLAAGASARGVLVSLPMLARSHPAVPPGVLDEARELATFGDVLDVWEPPDGDGVALLNSSAGAVTAYRDVVVPQRSWGEAPRVNLFGPLGRVLRDALSAWSLDGSVVLVRDPAGDQATRLATEGVTLDLSRGPR